MLVDETQLGEGQLKDRGVRNVQSLARVVKDQVLGYRFPYHEFEFHTDLKVVIVSKGKSLLPVSPLSQSLHPQMLTYTVCRWNA